MPAFAGMTRPTSLFAIRHSPFAIRYSSSREPTMADTYTSTLGVILMGIGGDNNTWGTNLNNSVFQIFEDAIANIGTFNVTGGTLDLSTNAPPAGPSLARYRPLVFTGSLASNP